MTEPAPAPSSPPPPPVAKPGSRLLSGIQPSGDLHLGNYLGAIRNWVDLMPRFDAFYCVVDLHAITVPYDPRELAPRTLEMARGLLAAGLDPKRCTLFVQSHVPGHADLGWIFSTIAPLGALERMTQWKDKAEQHREAENLGLFAYPVLQSADIALYKGAVVPVGEDQVQHLELAREIVRKFNRHFGETFPEPQPLLTATARVLGLDGKAKMSKSKGNTIPLFESDAATWEKLRTAVTDENRKRRTDPGNPDVCNIYSLHKFFSPADTVASVDRDCRTAAIGCVDCKKMLHGHLAARLAPIRERHASAELSDAATREILADGARRATAVARETMAEVRNRTGLLAPGGDRPGRE